MSQCELHPPKGQKDRGRSIPAPREQHDLPTHCVSQRGPWADHPRACKQPSGGTQPREEHFSPMLSSIPVLPLGNLWKVKPQSGEKKIKTKYIRVSSFYTCIFLKYCDPHGYMWGLQTWWSEALWRSSMLLAWVWFSFSLCVVEWISGGQGGNLFWNNIFYDPIGPQVRKHK